MNRYNFGEVACPKCGHSWPSVLLDGMPISCPNCGSVAGVPLDYAPFPLSLHHDRGKLFAMTDLSSRSSHPLTDSDGEDEDEDGPRGEEDLRTRPGGIALAGRLLLGFVGSALILAELHRLGSMNAVRLIAVVLVALAVAWPHLIRAAIILFRKTIRYQIGMAVCDVCGYRWRHVVLDGHPKYCPNCGRYTRKPLVPKPLVPKPLASNEADDSVAAELSPDPDHERVTVAPPKPRLLPRRA